MGQSIIRRATCSDMDALVELLTALFTLETDFNSNTEFQRKGLFLMLDRPKECCILVAEYNNKVIGMCTGQLLISTAVGGLKLLVEDVVVNLEHRGSGVGANLLSEIQKWAISCGVKRMDLLADEGNTPALNFYRKQNWNTTTLIALQKNCR